MWRVKLVLRLLVKRYFDHNEDNMEGLSASAYVARICRRSPLADTEEVSGAC